VRMVDSETTRIKFGRFLILGGIAGAASGFPGTMTSSGFGIALFAERDLSMGCAPLMERFFRAEVGRWVGIVVCGRGEEVFRARS